MRYLLVIVACVLQIGAGVYAESHYTVIGPGTIHSGHKYTVAVGVHHTDTPTQLKVGITGISYNETKTVDLQPNQVQNVEFDVPTLEQGNYNLTAEGVTGIIFKNTTKLNYDDFKPYVKIQTDKGTYKPGDVVNFRIIFLDENLRPAQPKKDAFVFFEDSKRNRVKEFKNLEAAKGVYTGKFQLSEFPLVGNWRLIVDNGERYKPEVFFSVQKYVLPKYTVSVDATKNIVVQDGDLHVVVKANYTYGKPVDGKVTLILRKQTFLYGADNEALRNPPTLIKATDMVNGKAKFDLNVKEYEAYIPKKYTTSHLHITATVEENFTGVKINATTSSSLYNYRYFINCLKYEQCYRFTAGEEKEVHIQVSKVDGTTLHDTKSILKLTYTEAIRKFYHHPTKENENEPQIEHKQFVFESHLNESNIATFKVTLPDLEEFENYSHFFNVELEYAGEKRDLLTTYQYRKPKEISNIIAIQQPKDWFTVSVSGKDDEKNVRENIGFISYLSNNFKIGEEAKVRINSSIPFSYFVYNLVGRGNIIHTERVELNGNSKVYEFKFKTNFFFSPHATIYIYYVDEHGQFHYDEASFNVEAELQNKLEIAAPDQVKPGDDVSLRIKTTPNSFVGLVAVDQSVLLLRDKNDFHDHDFKWRLGQYGTYTPWQGGFSRYPGERAGVVTLTNADYFYNWTQPIYGQETLTTLQHRSGISAYLPGTPVVAYQGSAVLTDKSASDDSSYDRAAIAVRKDFSETWLFADINNTETEEFTWTTKIPDTITSWVLTGFSLNSEYGLGLTKDSSKIKTFLPFFISVRLPYSVKRGEVINVPALVFNYLEKDLDVQVTLDNTDEEYEFTEVSNEILNDIKRTQTVKVPANSARGAIFTLRPKIVGNILLKFTAVSQVAGDAVHKTLKVVPEGVTEYANRAYFVNLKDTSEIKDTFELDLPKEVVPDSEHIEFGVVGDLLGPLLKNLQNLVRIPTGCGEQITSTLVPNFLVLRYLKAIDKLTPALENTIKSNLENGYQRLLSYRHDDGSFSSFGPSKDPQKPRNGSTWLTAYVVRSLNQASEFINIDQKILTKGLSYLISKQAKNGTFLENGEFFYSSHRHHITLTSSVLLAFLENNESAKLYQPHTDKGFKYILENLEDTKDLYANALATFTLHRAKHPLVSEKLAHLKTFVKTDGDRKWWSEHERPSHEFWWRWYFSNDVEITSYILLTLLDSETETPETVLPILKWLVAQRNSYGGFSSTQDTVVGLQALIKFVQKSGYKPAQMDITFTSKGDRQKQDSIKINNDNGILLQTVDLSQKTHSVDFTAKGTGAALVQISYQYNVVEKEKKPSFDIKTVINKDTPAFKLALDVCVEYVGENAGSNMAILEISLPSGYTADKDFFDAINSVDHVRQTETKNENSVVVVYFDSLHKGEVQCLPIEAYKSFAVALQKPSSIVLYDYYDTTAKATNYYAIDSKLCDLCESDEECKQKCK